MLGQLKFTVRRNYSSPPIHGGQLVAAVLGEPALRATWEQELGAMRERIQAMRKVLHATLTAKMPRRDFGYFLSQRGMFSYTGLGPQQVDRLREEFAVYLVRSGRLCVAGLNTGNVEADRAGDGARCSTAERGRVRSSAEAPRRMQRRGRWRRWRSGRRAPAGRGKRLLQPLGRAGAGRWSRR